MAKKKTSKRAHGQAGPALTGGAGSAVECLPGAILWLPPESEIPFPMGDEIPPDCYDHPVAVHSEVSDGNARILIVTSLKARSLKDVRWGLEIRSGYLPIAPADPHPDNQRLLRLDERCKELTKNSYINAASPRIVPLANLRHYNRNPKSRTGDYVLSSDSYELLVQYYDDIQAKLRAPLPDTGTKSYHRTPQSLGPLDDYSPAPVPPPAAPAFVPPIIEPQYIRPPTTRQPTFSETSPLARPISTAAREAPRSSVGGVRLNGYGTNPPAPPRAWSADLERHQDRRPAPKPGFSILRVLKSLLGGLGYVFGKLKPERNYRGEYPAFKVLKIMVALALLYGAGWVVVKIIVGLGIACRATVDFVRALCTFIHDKWFGAGDWIMGVIEKLKKLVGGLGGSS